MSGMLYSKINPSIPISTTNWAISLTVNGYHARLFIEKEEKDGSYYLGTADFIPGDKNLCYCVLYGMDFKQYFQDKAYDGRTRYDKVQLDTKKEEDRYVSNELGDIDYKKCTREWIFNKFHLQKFKGLTFLVTSTLAKKMLSEIQSQSPSIVLSPKFNIKGNIGDNVHNCCSWAAAMLTITGKTLLETYIDRSLGIYHLQLPDLPSEEQTLSMCLTM